MTHAKMKCSCGIDIHTHIVPEHFPAYVGSVKDVRWPSTEPAKQACHRHVMLSGSVYRTVSNQCWDGAVRLADMDGTGIGRQVLSPMPELLAYWLDGTDGAVLSRYLNETIANLIAHAPERFSGLGAVPLQDVDRAIAELDHAVHQLGLSGVEIGSNVNGVPIGDARFRPFFAAAEQWGAAVFVHALRPAGMDRLVGPPLLEQVLAFPGEIGLAAASMITGGTLAAHPALRIAFSHGAGSLQVLVARLHNAWELSAPLRDAIGESPREAARRMFYDNLLYDVPAIESLVRMFGDTQVMIGTDYPFAIMDRDPLGRVASLGFDEAVLEKLRTGNAARWLGLAQG